jgi:hypothetical protein
MRSFVMFLALFVNGITEKYADELGVCRASSGSWEAAQN